MPHDEDSITLTGAGDAIIARELRSFDHEQFHELVELIRDSDAAMVNLEILLHDYEGYPTGATTGTYMRAPPWVADELTWTGFNMFSAATNHAFDYSHGGMLATMRELEARNIAYAGLGRNLAAAREPAYVDTPAGRVALLSVCSSITSGSIAGEQRPDMQGRPGIAPLRHETKYEVPADMVGTVRELSENMELESLKEAGKRSSFSYTSPSDPEDGVTLPNVSGDDISFVEGDEYRLRRTANEDDVTAVTDRIGDAKRQADWVVVSLHAHQGPGGHTNVSESARFTEEFARTCADAGADAFFGHGPHVPHGIEVYNGTPLFHSLGNFVFQNQLVTRFPAEIYERYGLDPLASRPVDVFDERVYDEAGDPKGFLEDDYNWETFLPICEFDASGLVDITVYPVDLRKPEPRPRRGRPVLATDDRADEILTHITELSAKYDTTISMSDGVGEVSF